MKRAFLACVLITALLSGCVGRAKSSINADSKEVASRGIWISFSEINAMLESENGFEKEFETVVDNCESLKIQELYIHVRAYCDSLFESEYFPLVKAAAAYEYDIFEYIIEKCHSKGIKVHAWINPYRVLTSSTDINMLDSASPAYKWLNDDDNANDRNVLFSDGIYLNPAEYEVQRLVIDGIREILRKYEVDGIHFDDYFYPTTDEAFDSVSYNNYISDTETPLSLEDWRRSNVNALISGCYTAIKFTDKKIIFSVSPTASIDYNYNTLYADVKTWVESGCVDYIIPQLYFGFEYPKEEFRFDKLLKDWKGLAECNTDVGLLIGLGSYKIGTDTENDREEWNSSDDIISRQAELCYKDEQISGYVLFSYTSVFSDDTLNRRQRENLIDVINSHS